MDVYNYFYVGFEDSITHQIPNTINFTTLQKHRKAQDDTRYTVYVSYPKATNLFQGMKGIRRL